MQSGSKFRKDLYYRLASHHVHIPPLRERPMDIEPLLNFFCKQEGAPPFSSDVIEYIEHYAFPGNVRELQNLVRDLRGLPELTRELIAARIHQRGAANLSIDKSALPRTDGVFPTLCEVQEYWIDKALNQTAGNQSAPAKLLGVTRQGLNKRLRKSCNDPANLAKPGFDQDDNCREG
jgi:DNA-binding NtrC family response regulator